MEKEEILYGILYILAKAAYAIINNTVHGI